MRGASCSCAYARSLTQSGLTIVACIGLLSLIVQGYRMLTVGILGAISGISALAFISYERQHLWDWWFPDQPFNPTIKRWLRYLPQALAGGFTYAHVRAHINLWTGVDPGNFPTALAADIPTGAKCGSAIATS
jgi:hypothetical protein